MRASVDLARCPRGPRSHGELGEEIGDAFAERVAQERVVLARGHGLLLGVHRLVHDEANERFETMRGEALLRPGGELVERSEERRVGKEGRWGWRRGQERKTR